jgi:hypothetical protein
MDEFIKDKQKEAFIGFRLPEEIKEKLILKAKEKNIDISAMVRHLIFKYIK